MRTFRYIDVSGVGNAGKTAITDFLREHQGFLVPENIFEFDLFRVPGGLVDLSHHLVENWTLIRSDRAIKDFREILYRMGVDAPWYDVRGKLRGTGQRLDRRFNGRFLELANRFVQSLETGSFSAYWPYDWLQWGPGKTAIKKLLWKAGFSTSVQSSVHLTSAGDFSRKVTDFINSLYDTTAPSGTTHVAFNNAFEPFQPQRSLDLLHGSKAIVVYRDPRDVYSAGLTRKKAKGADRALQPPENDGRKSSFLGSDDLDIFVLRYRTLMENLYRGDDCRVLLLRFEDVVLNYDEFVRRAHRFLEIDPQTHVRPRRYFDPERSKKNIGLWERYSNQSEVRFIGEKLSPFIWQ